MEKLQFYDVAMRPPANKNNTAVNPWKTRLALNFKQTPYKTTWVQLPDIPYVRKSLSIPACRKFADGTDFHTLPILVDPATGRKLGDSFDIAVYLQKQYPTSGGNLFPAQTLDYVFKPESELLIPLSECDDSEYPQYASFNVNVDAAFTAHVILMAHRMPFDPATEEASKAEFVRRAGVSSWDDFAVGGEVRENIIASFERMLGGLAKLFTASEGPFIGETACYADFIVGAWLVMASRTLPEGEWEAVKGWHGGVFGRLFDALAVYAGGE
jgi:glutathione S-transferase